MTAGTVVLALALVLAVIVGIYVRLWILGNQSMNSDEATAGLMAHAALHGHASAFYWGQDYGGGEPYLAAVIFAIAGQSAFTLNVTPALLALVAAVLVWRIGIRIVAKPAAVAAAALTWVWGEAILWNSVREFGFRGVTLVTGLLSFLLVLRIVAALNDRQRAFGDWALLGLALGIGWWSSPEIVYFAIPVAVVILWETGKRWTAGYVANLALAAAGFVIGSLPWTLAFLHDGSAIFQQAPSPVGYGGRLQLFFTHAAPIALGVRVEGEGSWLGAPWLGVLVLMLMLALTLAGVLVLWRNPSSRLLILFVVLFPLLYASFTATYFWNDARYLPYLPPILALVWMGALWQLKSEVAKGVAGGVLLLATLSTLFAFNASYDAFASIHSAFSGRANPNGAVATLQTRLQHDHIKYALANYWLANNLSFLSNGQVTAIDPEAAHSPPDIPNQDAEVAERTWIFVNPQDIAASESALGVPGAPSPGSLPLSTVLAWAHEHSIPWRSESVGPFEIVRFPRSVSIGDITGA